ncbi:hypothetical protein FB451DRAFT_1365873 [Mycena latifolia]|nr:hypothetical protein FB451DRAFT_1365873 [Mycena latifolia]
MYEQSRTSDEGSDQIPAKSDGLIESYGIADRNPRRGDINFLPSDRSPHLASLFLHHFFIDPRSLWLIVTPRFWASIYDDTGCQWAEGTISNHPISVSLIVGFFGGAASILGWSWAFRTLVHLTTPILGFPIGRKQIF